jgi:hypothetical protein
VKLVFCMLIGPMFPGFRVGREQHWKSPFQQLRLPLPTLPIKVIRGS